MANFSLKYEIFPHRQNNIGFIFVIFTFQKIIEHTEFKTKHDTLKNTVSEDGWIGMEIEMFVK
jgi:hypothetical protein